MTEIRPLRPNQSCILPGVAVLGQGLKFEVKERTKYRSRNGFSQSDGIAQYSANFYRSRKPRKIEDYHRPPSYEPYRPQRPKTIFAGHSDDESYLNNHRTISSSSSTTHFPELKIGNGSSPNPKPPLYQSTSKKSLVPILKAERRNNPTLEKKFPWEVPKYQNPLFNGCESDEELIKPTSAMASAMAAGIDPFYRNGSVSPKFTSHHALCTNQGRNKATSSQGVLNTYDFLFDRHLRMLTNMESDQDVNEEEVKTLHSINQPLETNVEEVTEDSSMDESDELSILGEDLVNRSLAEVTSLLDQQIDLNSESMKKTNNVNLVIRATADQKNIIFSSLRCTKNIHFFSFYSFC